MLRITLVCFGLTVFAVCVFVTPRARSTETLQRLTNTSEQTLNLNPMLSDDGSVVVFESTADIAEVGDSQSFHALRTSGPGGFEEFAHGRLTSVSLAANGQKIAFASTEDLTGDNQDRNSEIYLYDGFVVKQLTHTLPASEATRLTDGNFEPSISSNGLRVCFTSNLLHNSFEVYLLNVDSGSLTAITDTSSNIPLRTKLSGNGSRIFFVNGTDLFVYEVDFRTTRKIVEDTSALSLTAGRAVSNDGNRIVYSAETAPNQTQVFLFDLRENQTRQLTQLGTRVTDVPLNSTISGDGKRVAFATRRRVTTASEGSVELYLIDLPTLKIEQITNAPANATAEIVSSLNYDGSRIAFNFSRALSGPVSDSDFANNSEIYLASLADRPDVGVVKIANGATRDFNNSHIAPDSIGLLSGNNLCNRTEQAQGELPLAIDGTTVQVGGVSARLIYASPTEVLFVVPPILRDGPVEVAVTNSEGYRAKTMAIVSRVSPGIFSVENQGVILNADTFKASPFDPSVGELRLALFATGVRHATQLNITIGEEPVPVETIQPSNFPGLDEIHVKVPAELRGAGSVILTVKADGADANSVATSLSGSPLRDILINEILTDPPDGPAGDANHDGTRDSSADEFVELVNTTTRDIDLTGYQLLSKSSTAANETIRHRFAAGMVIPAGTAIVIFGGGVIDASNAVFGGAQVIRASTSGLSLSNSAGSVTLCDSLGHVVSAINYGSAVGLPGDANQSITRAPDLIGPLTLHQSVIEAGGRAFSPGTRINGEGFLPTPAVASVVISPSIATILRGAEQQFTAKAFDDQNRELEGVIFNWRSSNTSILTIDANGLAKAIASGNSEVTASGRGIRSVGSLVTVLLPSPSPTPTPIPSPSPSPSPSATPTPTPVPSPSASPSPSVTPTATPTPEPSPSPSPSPSPTPSPTVNVVISQIFGGGGNSGAPLRNDFIELFNTGTVSVSLTGWSVQYAGATASSWSVTNLSAVSLAPGQYFLIQEAGGSNGALLPTPDVTGTINLAATAGKVALVKATTQLTGTCPVDSNIVDFVGYGTTANCFKGPAPAPAPSNTNAALRGNAGCANSTNNAADFTAASPTPRNTASAFHFCANQSAKSRFAQERFEPRWLLGLFVEGGISISTSCRGSPSLPCSVCVRYNPFTNEFAI
ncbi:MAG TPA: lamin tail domain-containing protein [Pyrinomonadaceae bacterium]